VTRQLEQMPSLKNYLAVHLPRIYELAVRKTLGETGFASHSFPAACPFTLDQILDARFFPV